MLWMSTFAWAYQLSDVGQARQGTAALIVVTPGVQEAAYLTWVEALEAEGLDAWSVTFKPRGQDLDTVVAEVGQAYAELSAQREVVVAAHGYGGVLVLLAGLDTRMALVGTPLAKQPVSLVLEPAPSVVAETLPFSPELIGPLPMEPYSAELALAYRAWTTEFPDYVAPTSPVLLIASNLDPVAPPECVRLPSQDWPQRQWERAGLLGLYAEDFGHAQLLLDPGIAEHVATWLSGSST